jgi:hypothetical protein
MSGHIWNLSKSDQTLGEPSPVMGERWVRSKRRGAQKWERGPDVDRVWSPSTGRIRSMFFVIGPLWNMNGPCRGWVKSFYRRVGHNLTSARSWGDCWDRATEVECKWHVGASQWLDPGTGVSGQFNRRVRPMRKVPNEGVQRLYLLGGYKTKY